jgi:hypothetical protein
MRCSPGRPGQAEHTWLTEAAAAEEEEEEEEQA